MFGIGPTEIILIVIICVLLFVAFVAAVAIVLSMVKYYSGKREARLEARIAELEKRLSEQQQK